MSHWQKCLQEHWNLQTQLEPLDGEYDLNFKATTDSGRCYLVKVMRAGCDTAFVDMQCQALAHIRSHTSGLHTPKVIFSNAGNAAESTTDDQGNLRLVWVLEYLDGVLYADFQPKILNLVEQLGSELGKLHQALSDFSHGYLQRDFKWNLLQAGWISNKLDVIADSSRRQTLESVINQYNLLLPSLLKLPALAIHNDINSIQI